MGRPSANLDKKMLEAGVQIIISEGVEGLTARNICKYAEVNLGMFNYYFKSKDYYITLLYSGVHKHIEECLDLDSVKDKNSLVKLKHSLLKIGRFTKENPELSRAMFADVFYRYKTYKDYVDRGIIPQFNLLINLIIAAKEDGYLRPEIAAMDIFNLLFFGCIVPGIYSMQIEDLQKYRKLKKENCINKNSFSKRLELLFNEIETIDTDRNVLKIPSGF